MFKIPHGAYWSVLIAIIPLTLIIIFTSGQSKLYKVIKPIPLDEFLEQYKNFSHTEPHLEGTAVFLSKKLNLIPSYVPLTMFSSKIIYQENIIVSVNTQDSPYGIIGAFKNDTSIPAGLRIFEIKIGYLEIMNLDRVLKSAGINPNVIFYGLEEIRTKSFIWKVFVLIKKLTPSFVEFYKLPANKLHGVVVRAEM